MTFSTNKDSRILKTHNNMAFMYIYPKGQFKLVVEVHLSILFKEWTDTIGYKMGFSTAKVHTLAKTSPVEKFKHGWEKDRHGCRRGNTFCQGILLRRSFMAFKELRLESTFILPYGPLDLPMPHQITLSWADIFGRLVQFFTVV